MNWRRILVVSLLLVVIPQVIGFLFGITAGFWQDYLSPSEGLWARRIAIGATILLIYAWLASIQQARRAAHIFLVFVVSELLMGGLQLGLGGALGSLGVWVAWDACAAFVGWAIGTTRSREVRAV